MNVSRRVTPTYHGVLAECAVHAHLQPVDELLAWHVATHLTVPLSAVLVQRGHEAAPRVLAMLRVMEGVDPHDHDVALRGKMESTVKPPSQTASYGKMETHKAKSVGIAWYNSLF